MKISISFPPLVSEKGIPLLSQNRQFQWFNSPTYIYPVIPAYLATILKNDGNEVFWDDGIAEGLSYEQWLERIIKEQPDVIVMETKTPAIKRHWQITDSLKLKVESYKVSNENWQPKIILVGDHVTALPEESLKNSQVDFVVAGGDYDFIISSLIKKLKGEPSFAKASPYAKATGDKTEGKLEGGIYWRENGVIKNSGVYDLKKHSLDELPMIDRELTKWKLYAYKNGNFKYTPGTYLMSGRDCWWGKCAFCSWTTLFPGNCFRARSAKLVLDEVGHLIDLGVKEIMEDSGSLPVGRWLEDFCNGMIERGYNKKITLSCNMRLNGIKDEKTWQLMKRAGFRFVLFGLESANQNTLDKINKGLRVEEIEPGLKMCKAAGLEPHITAMIGYSWETYDDAKKTVDLAKDLFKKGYVDTLQATILIPYPGTPLYKYCLENNLLNFTDYDRFDQREQVMKSPLTNEQVKELTQGLYKSFLTPKFILKKVLAIRSIDDIRFLFRAGIKVLGHLADFKNN
jgi:anaerobic magnesium-protoporphyrin IX monomethyl ester cyclase